MYFLSNKAAKKFTESTDLILRPLKKYLSRDTISLRDGSGCGKNITCLGDPSSRA